jgi:hypothetical protein
VATNAAPSSRWVNSWWRQRVSLRWPRTSPRQGRGPRFQTSTEQRSPRIVGPPSLLPRAAPPLVQQRTYARSAQAARLELARELRNHIPFLSSRRSRQGDCQSVIDARLAPCGLPFTRPKRDQLTSTYVTSRRVTRTRVDVSCREFNTFGGFDPPLLQPKSPRSWLRRETHEVEAPAGSPTSSGAMGKAEPNPSRKLSTSRK